MTKREIRELREKIGTDPILTDEEIEHIWTVMDKAEPMKPDELKIPRATIFRCPSCKRVPDWPYDHCPKCGQKLDWNEEEKE